MSRPEEIFVSAINASTALTAIISSSVGAPARCYPVNFPEGGSLPGIVYSMTSDSPVNHATGATDTHETHIEAICMSTSYSGVKALAAALETEIVGASTDGNIWHLDSSRDEPGAVKIGQDIREYYGVTHDYSVWN